MGGLRLDEQLIHGGDADIVQQLQIDAQSDAGKKLHRFFRGHHGGILQRAESPADAVVQGRPAVAGQRLAGLAFVDYDVGYDFADLVEDGRFALAEGDLVGDLIKIARRPAPFAVQAAHGQVNLLQGPENLLDLLRQHHAGVKGLSAGSWQGPIESMYGAHLVWVSQQQPGNFPTLDAARSRVLSDVMNERMHRADERAMDELRSHYQVNIDRAALAPASSK